MIRGKDIKVWFKYKLFNDMERTIEGMTELCFEFARNIVHIIYSNADGSSNRFEFELTQLEYCDWGPKDLLLDHFIETNRVSHIGESVSPFTPPDVVESPITGASLPNSLSRTSIQEERRKGK